MIWTNWAARHGVLEAKGKTMKQIERRVGDLEKRPGMHGPNLENVVIINEGETPPADATFVIELCSPKLDANGRAMPDA
jgi:hypothetical protein